MPWIQTSHIQAPEEIFPESFLWHWRRLALSGDEADPFCCAPVWNLAYHHVVNSGRRLFYAASPLGAVIFGEYFNEKGERMLLPVEDSWLYGKPLLGPDAPFLLTSVMEELQEGANSTIFLSGILSPSPGSFALYREFSYAFNFYRNNLVQYQKSASLLDGMDGWLGRRSANTRANLRKAIKNAEKAGVTFERICPRPDESDVVYDRILAIEKMSWKGKEHCGMLEQPSRDLYRTMLRMLAADSSALVIFARLCDEDIGFIFGGLHGPYYRGQQFSYKQDFRHLSIGNLLQYNTILWLIELGCIRYDMGPATGPRMEYKSRWAEREREFQTWILAPKN